ncbi:ATP-grasp domain-containing protein [Acetobacterium paludosum]|uniref:ATP-grasp domain-containing protein n=1 Tax=Acetobacterium paludosum TaxID=52693 RepID=A0A923HUL3_9FIRM|nr:ATP-grasp domain-containing protein [Acetobacterium paludosum]MBC3888878.1 ATP-grasp domain-containing protein [Acetobacterium paludosum]
MKRVSKNLLFCSVGRRGELIKNFKASLEIQSRIIATDCSQFAPALYFADKPYIVPRIDDPSYLKALLKICKAESINAITTFIDPEIEILAKNRKIFEEIGIEVLAPYTETAGICFDKYKLYQHAVKHNIPTISTYGDIEEFKNAYTNGQAVLPVFIKPRTGSGSVGVRKVEKIKELEQLMAEDRSLIIQKHMTGFDIDADVYVDTISKKAVRIFSKKKLESKIGGATKTISFKDENLVQTIQKIIASLNFNGPIDVDFFYEDGVYYLSEINPRFGGAYLHAYGAGVNFVNCIINNLQGIENDPDFYSYDNGIVMMMYDSVVIRKENELAK